MSSGKSLELSKNDLKQIEQKRITKAEIIQQLKNLVDGFPMTQLTSPCTLQEGLRSFEGNLDDLVKKYQTQSADLNIVKFVPASGAASRMFKHLYDFLEDGSQNPQILELINSLEQFPFYNQLQKSLDSKRENLEKLTQNKEFKTIVGDILNEEGLNYGSLPKALITFHLSNEHKERTPIDEHFEEGAFYAKSKNNIVNLHFTISPEHLKKIDVYVRSCKNYYEKEHNVTYNITYSLQQPNTDTIALGNDLLPIRNNDETLLFRPSGHGALLQNLQELDADLIFVKNIDNVVPSFKHQNNFKYKQAMGSVLLSQKVKIDKILTQLKEVKLSENELSEILNFLKDDLLIPINEEKAKNNIRSYLMDTLNKPIRVCGMVKNQGAPGGGPFWVKNSKGDISLQIVESSQINLNDPAQRKIFDNSTHFNPVDIVCSTKNFEGKKFNLMDFRDDYTGLISEKSKNGKTFKALELPGLWNGSMANWISIFVEVPIETFNPVKTINDLLKPMHK